MAICLGDCLYEDENGNPAVQIDPIKGIACGANGLGINTTGCLAVDSSNNLTVNLWSSTCTEYPTDITKNGIYCRTSGGQSKLYVAPDAHGRVFIQSRNASFTLDGAININPNFTNANSGSSIYNTRAGTTPTGAELTEIVPYYNRTSAQGSVVMHNFSCARIWDYDHTHRFESRVTVSGGVNATAYYEESFDGSNWNSLQDLPINDNTTRVEFTGVTWRGGVAPGSTIYTDFRVRVVITSGNLTFNTPRFDSIYTAVAKL